MTALFSRFVREETGQGLIEYLLLGTLIAICRGDRRHPDGRQPLDIDAKGARVLPARVQYRGEAQLEIWFHAGRG